MHAAFETSSFYLAAFLKCRGVELQTVRCDGYGDRQTFVFHDQQGCKQLADAFLFGKDDQVSAKAYMATIKELKSVLYDGRR